MPRIRRARLRSPLTATLAAIAGCATAVWLAADPARATRSTPFDAIATEQRASSGARAGSGRARLAGWSADTASGTSASDPRALGDRFERACRAGARIEDSLASDHARSSHRRAVIRRWDQPNEIFVACLVPGDREALHRTLHARREGARTRWTLVWSDELASADALDPERHGQDLPGVPRPAGARRVASGAAGSSERWVSYELSGDLRETLEAAGFELGAARTLGTSEAVYLARRGARALFVVQRGTTVTLFESAAGSLDGAVNEWRTNARPTGAEASGPPDAAPPSAPLARAPDPG